MTVEVIDPATGELRQAPVPLDSSGSGELKLELAPGADSIQVIARNETGVEAWIEMQAQPGEDVAVAFDRAPGGELRVFPRDRRDFLVLSDKEPPKPLLFQPRKTDELNVVILVDGTCLHPYPEDKPATLEYLLGLSEVWQRISSSLATFLTTVSTAYPKLWSMAAAFGDEPVSLISNSLLKPKYLVYPQIPEARKLEPLSIEKLMQQLRTLPHTPGGDFVDGLADGLRACMNAKWRGNSRRLVIVFGQSPGYSLADSDDMINFVVRKACIEEEVAALHRDGVEIVTIYHDPPVPEEAYRVQLPEIFERARKQYESLATLKEWSTGSTAMDAAALAEAWLHSPISLARGPAPGLLAGP